MILTLETANDVFKLQKIDSNLSEIYHLLISICDKLNMYYTYNSSVYDEEDIIHGENELMTFQRKIIELSNFDEMDIKTAGMDCVKIINNIIIKNKEWERTGKKPVDTENQV